MIKKFLWLILVFALCLGFTGAAQANLVAYYPFDGDTCDWSGNVKDGVYWSNGSSTATPTFVTGQVGKAISLRAFASYGTDGVGIGSRINQGVILPDESYFDFVDAIGEADGADQRQDSGVVLDPEVRRHALEVRHELREDVLARYADREFPARTIPAPGDEGS